MFKITNSTLAERAHLTWSTPVDAQGGCGHDE